MAVNLDARVRNAGGLRGLDGADGVVFAEGEITGLAGHGARSLRASKMPPLKTPPGIRVSDRGDAMGASCWGMRACRPFPSLSAAKIHKPALSARTIHIAELIESSVSAPVVHHVFFP